MSASSPSVCEPTLSLLVPSEASGTLVGYATAATMVTSSTGGAIVGYATMASIISYGTAEGLLSCFAAVVPVLRLEDTTVLSDITYLEG